MKVEQLKNYSRLDSCIHDLLLYNNKKDADSKLENIFINEQNY